MTTNYESDEARIELRRKLMKVQSILKILQSYNIEIKESDYDPEIYKQLLALKQIKDLPFKTDDELREHFEKLLAQQQQEPPNIKKESEEVIEERGPDSSAAWSRNIPDNEKLVIKTILDHLEMPAYSAIIDPAKANHTDIMKAKETVSNMKKANDDNVDEAKTAREQLQAQNITIKDYYDSLFLLSDEISAITKQNKAQP